MLITSWRVPGHSHVCSCLLHLFDECVGGGTGRTDVINQQNTLAVEIVCVYLHIACGLLIVLLADMHFLTLADNLDMLEAVDSLAFLTYACGETLVPTLVGLLATGRDAHEKSAGTKISGDGSGDHYPEAIL